MNRPFWSLNRPSSSEPSSETCDGIDPLLSLYADGMASPEEARRIDAHLPGCDTCRESLAWIRATQRTLASRPIMTPPANLHSRIAFAIAASSSAPSMRPARSFTLRPAQYAAAASFAILGLVGYSLWHTPAPVAVTHPSQPVRTASVPAVKTPVKISGQHLAPKVHTLPLVANNVPAPVKHITLPRHDEPDTPPVLHTPMAFNVPPIFAPLTHLGFSAVKAHVPTSPPAAHMASRGPAPVGTHPPIVPVKTITPKQPEPQKVADNTQAHVPVNILTPEVTQDPEVKTTLASTNMSPKTAGFLDTVKGHLGEINSGGFQAASYVVSHQSYHGTEANAMHALDTEHTAYQGVVYSP